MGQFFTKMKYQIKEGVRKLLVSLKRNPQFIPLCLHLISFLVYSLNFTYISRTTEIILGKNMGLCSFATMLFSMLLFICMLNAFPKRQRPNALMIILIFALLGIIIFADITYINTIVAALAAAEGGLSIVKYPYIATAQTAVATHVILSFVTVGAVILEPLFAKLLRKINTSIEVEDNGKIGNIELTED